MSDIDETVETFLQHGGPAFPMRATFTRGLTKTTAEFKGMSLRDWFAGQALVGILSGGFANTIPHDDAEGGRQAAAFAYQYADAMLKARGEQP